MIKTDEERTAILDRRVAELSLAGWTVTTVTPGRQAVLQQQRVNKAAVAAFGVFAAGAKKVRTVVVTVDDHGILSESSS